MRKRRRRRRRRSYDNDDGDEEKEEEGRGEEHLQERLQQEKEDKYKSANFTLSTGGF